MGSDTSTPFQMMSDPELMASNIVTETELMEGLGIKQRPALIRYLAAKGIPFELNPAGKVWTVQRALDEHVIVRQKPQIEDDGEWEIGHAAKKK